MSDDYTVTLSPRAFKMICGLVNGTSIVDPDYVIASEAEWDEIRKAFPVGEYQDLPPDEDGVPNGGWGSAVIASSAYAGPMNT